MSVCILTSSLTKRRATTKVGMNIMALAGLHAMQQGHLAAVPLELESATTSKCSHYIY